jgi:hypothetical protein
LHQQKTLLAAGFNVKTSDIPLNPAKFFLLLHYYPNMTHQSLHMGEQRRSSVWVDATPI